MAWCERQRVGYIFGLAGNKVLLRQVSPLAEEAALGRLDGEGEKVRRYGDFRYAAKSWTVERRVIARIEAGPEGADSRFIVTNLPGLSKMLYEDLQNGSNILARERRLGRSGIGATGSIGVRAAKSALPPNAAVFAGIV